MPKMTRELAIRFADYGNRLIPVAHQDQMWFEPVYILDEWTIGAQMNTSSRHATQLEQANGRLFYGFMSDTDFDVLYCHPLLLNPKCLRHDSRYAVIEGVVEWMIDKKWVFNMVKRDLGGE